MSVNKYDVIYQGQAIFMHALMLAFEPTDVYFIGELVKEVATLTVPEKEVIKKALRIIAKEMEDRDQRNS